MTARRKTLHPFWACWFTSLLLWPLGVGFSVWTASLADTVQWYVVMNIIYNVLHFILLLAFLGRYCDYIPLLRERPLTDVEREQAVLDREFPGV